MKSLAIYIGGDDSAEEAPEEHTCLAGIDEDENVWSEIDYYKKE